MGPVSAKVAIDVPREEVFEILMDLSARPSFTDHFMEGFHLLRIEPVGVGAGARFKLRDAGWVDSVIDEVDAPAPAGRARARRLPQPHPERDRVAALGDRPRRLRGPGHLLDRAGARSSTRCATRKTSERRLGKGLKKALERLREVAESGAPPERIAVAGGDRIARPGTST